MLCVLDLKNTRLFCEKYGITISTSSPYHSKGNGKTQARNKFKLNIIKIILNENKRS